jgi:arylsulfatase I/J
VHKPYEVPAAYNTSFSFIADPNRRLYHAMVKYVDDVIGEIVQELKTQGYWDMTLMVLTTGTGSTVYCWPLVHGRR